MTIAIWVVIVVCALAECINYSTFRSRKRKVLEGSVNNDKPHHSSKFTRRWTRYFTEDDNVLQLLFDTYYRKLDFNNFNIKDILLLIYEYTGDLKPKTVNTVIKKLENKGIKFSHDVNDKNLIKEIKSMGIDDVVDSFHIIGRTKLIPVYKPLICNVLLKLIHSYTYYSFVWDKYTVTQTPENIRLYYLKKSVTKPTLVVFPGIGIGPVIYKNFINSVDCSILIVDCPNVNVCHHHFTDKILLNVIYRRTIDHLKTNNIESVILFGHSFGTINVTNFVYNNLKTEDIDIRKIFLTDPICFFAGFARLYASIYRYLNTPQRSMRDRFWFNMLHGDIGNQYMFYRQLRPYLGTYHFSIEDTDKKEDKEKYKNIQEKTVVFAAQRDSYINYPTLWSHLKKFFPYVTRENYYGYHSEFIFDKDTYGKVADYIKSAL